MDTDDYNDPSPWRPTTDLLELAVIGKLSEEAGELIEVLGESLPWTSKPVENELADVLAMMSLTVDHYTLTIDVQMPPNGKQLISNLGKLVEVVSRCVIQGIDELDPGTGLFNRKRLEDIISIVTAQINRNISDRNLDRKEIDRRVAMKRRHKGDWHDQIRRGEIV